MNKQIEALKMAVEAIKNIMDSLDEKQVWYSVELEEAIQACKEALEQPAQEPYAWACEGILEPISNETKLNEIGRGFTWTKKYNIPLLRGESNG